MVLATNFPKLLNLKHRHELRKAHTILSEIENGSFVETDYSFERERLQSLFWIPDVLCRPDAIYKMKQGFGVVKAEEIYLKVYKKQNVGSPVKVVFTKRVDGGKKRNWVVISSYFTSRSTAKLYTDGEPLWPLK